MAEEAVPELLQQERDIRARLDDGPFDFVAMQAIQNIYRAAASVRRRAERELLAGVGLSWGGFTILWVLWVWGSMESSALASECDLAKGTVTGIVSTLEKRDLVDRKRPGTDRRRVKVALTPAGQALIEDVYPRFHRIEADLVAGLPVDQQRALAQGLRHIITNADSAQATP